MSGVAQREAPSIIVRFFKASASIAVRHKFDWDRRHRTAAATRRICSWRAGQMTQKRRS